MTVLLGLGLVFTYLGSSLILFPVLVRLMDPDEETARELFFASLGLGPLTIAWLMTGLLTIVPGRSDLFYVGCIAAVFALLLFFAAGKIGIVGTIMKRSAASLLALRARQHWTIWVLMAMIAVLAVRLFILSASCPITENDALQYSFVSKLMYERKALDFYPLITPDPATGFYAVSSHPPAYMGLMAWTYLIQGGASPAAWIKIISPMFVVYTLWLLAAILSRRPRFVRLVGMLLLIATPHYFVEASNLSIDPLRIYAFTTAVFGVVWVLRADHPRAAVALGFAAGLSMFSHSLAGLLTLPILSCIYLLRSRCAVRRRILSLAVLGVVALLIGGQQYLQNYRMFGTPIYDDLPVYRVEGIGQKEWIRQERNLVSLSDRLVHGFFMGFTRLQMFALSYWLGALGLAISFRRVWRDPDLFVFCSTIALFYGVVLATLLVGTDAIVGSYRYVLTIQPFVACLGAVAIGRTHDAIVTAH